MSYLDRVAPEAQAIGAVNIIAIHGDELIGYNTDWQGFLTALSEGGFNPQGKRAVVLGAGGAARAVVYALAKAGAKECLLGCVWTRSPSTLICAVARGLRTRSTHEDRA